MCIRLRIKALRDLNADVRTGIRSLEKHVRRLKKREDRLREKQVPVNPWPIGTDEWHLFNLRGHSIGHIEEIREVEGSNPGLQAIGFVYAPDTFVLSEDAQRWIALNRDFLGALSVQTGVPEELLGYPEVPEEVDNGIRPPEALEEA